MSNLYSKIQDLCKKAGFKNITELCRVAGIPRSSLSELNMGRSETLSYPTLQKIAAACNVTIEEITSEEKPAEAGELASVDESGKKEPAANAADSLDVSMLTEEERGKVAAFMAGLISARQKP